MIIDVGLEKRLLLFLFGCIGFRTSMAVLAKYVSLDNLQIMGYISLMPAFGLIYIYLTGVREGDLGGFGGKIWWNNFRPLHSFLYFLFAYNAINRNPKSWRVLALDVTVGFIVFCREHINNGNVEKIFA